MKKRKLTNNKTGRGGIIQLKRNAFTLIELLAIIVILAIIAVITVPIILNIIENSRKGAAKDSAYAYKDSINKFYLEKLSNDSTWNDLDGDYTINSDGNLVKSGVEPYVINTSGDKPNAGGVLIENKKITQACLKIGDYAVPITNGEVGEPQKTSCNGKLIGSSNQPDSPQTTTAAQTIMASAITEDDLGNYTETTLKVPVQIHHDINISAENSATGSQIGGEDGITDYRYMGADPDNYIYFNCNDYSEDAQQEVNGVKNCELWRIISVENGQLKITTDNVIGDGSWDDGSNHDGNYVNDWATSGLHDFLNGKYLNGGVAYSYTKNGKEISVDNKTYLDYYSDSFSATSSGTTGKGHTFLNSETKALIANSTWYLGGGNSSSITADQVYTMERGNVRCTDDYTRTTSVSSKVGIISPSDYGFASSTCYRGDGQKNLRDYGSYYDSTCTSSNWMYIDTYQDTWLLSPDSGNSFLAWSVYFDGGVYNDYYVGYAYGVRPVVYLISDISLSGSGTSSNPYKIIR